MTKPTEQKNSPALGKAFLFLLVSSLCLYFYAQKWFILTSFYIIIVTFGVIFFNKRKFKKKIKNLFLEHSKLKNLEFYYLMDDNKTIDLEKRKKLTAHFKI